MFTSLLYQFASAPKLLLFLFSAQTSGHLEIKA